jgi:hypothetical protein
MNETTDFLLVLLHVRADFASKNAHERQGVQSRVVPHTREIPVGTQRYDRETPSANIRYTAGEWQTDSCALAIVEATAGRTSH